MKTLKKSEAIAALVQQITDTAALVKKGGGDAKAAVQKMLDLGVAFDALVTKDDDAEILIVDGISGLPGAYSDTDMGKAFAEAKKAYDANDMTALAAALKGLADVISAAADSDTSGESGSDEDEGGDNPTDKTKFDWPLDIAAEASSRQQQGKK